MAADNRTVLHGIDQSVPTWSNLPDKGNWAAQVMVEDLLSRHIYEAASKEWLPVEYVVALYDFYVQGGTTGAKSLTVEVPSDTIVMDGFIDVIDPFTSDGNATVAVHVEAANDVYTATAITTDLAAVGLKDIIPVATAATSFKTTLDRAVTLTIGTAALKSGKAYIYLRTLRGFPSEEMSSSSSVSSSSSSVSSSSSSSSHSSSSTSSCEYSTSSSSSMAFSSSSSSSSKSTGSSEDYSSSSSSSTEISSASLSSASSSSLSSGGVSGSSQSSWG